MMTSIADSDTLQQLADSVGEEPCIGDACDNVGPAGVCKECREHFVRYFKNRATYERIAFGFTPEEREKTDRLADIVFGPVAPLALSEKLKRMVPSGDPVVMVIAEEAMKMDDGSLLSFLAQHQAKKDEIDAQTREMVEEIAAPHTIRVQVARAVVLDRILERRGKKIPSTHYKCELTAAKEIDKRMDVLLQLFEVLDADILKATESLWISGVDASEVVKDPDKLKALLDLGCKPVFTAHAGNLRKLARDCGGKVAEIIDNGVVDTFKTPQLVFEILPSKEKNVTPAEAVG